MAAAEEKSEVKKPRAMNLVLLQEVSVEEAPQPDLEAGECKGKLFRVVADETENLRDDDQVTKWMEKNGFEGELYVAAFRKGAGKRSGTNGRLRRRRFKPAGFVTE